MPKLGWRWLLALSSLPSFVLLIFYRATPESPRYLCMKGCAGAAADILNKIATQNFTSLPPGHLISDSQMELEEITDSSMETAHLVSDQDQNENFGKKSGGLEAVIMLFNPKLVRSTLLLWIVFLGNAFSYYGIVLLTSELNNGNKDCKVKEVRTEHLNNDGLYKNVFISSFAGNVKNNDILLLKKLSEITEMPSFPNEFSYKNSLWTSLAYKYHRGEENLLLLCANETILIMLFLLLIYFF